MKLITITFAVLSVVPQFNYQPPTMDTPRSNEVVSNFVIGYISKYTELHNVSGNNPQGLHNQFPDRSKEAEIARQVDIQREQARLQAIEAQRIAEANKVPVVAQSTPTIAPLSLQEGMLKLRQCESGGNYAINTGNGYYGAYQYDLQTWGNFMGFARPDLAPPDVQDAKFLETYNRRGKSPWPSCGRYLP